MVDRRTIIKAVGGIGLALGIGSQQAAAEGSHNRRTERNVNDDTDTLPACFSTDIQTVSLYVENEAGNRAPFDDPDTPLYEARGRNPVLSPDDRHVTWDEFSGVEGAITVECREGGTHVELLLSGLIPDGLYTLWVGTFGPGGFDPEAEDPFQNLRGVGAMGPPDGSENDVRASASGQARIGATVPGGPLSMFGEIGDCALTDEYEFHVVGAYNLDDQSYGPDFGPEGTAVEQFLFAFT